MRFRLVLGLLGAAGAVFPVLVGSVLVRYGTPDALPEVALRTLVSLLLCVVGLWIGASRPDQRTTRSAALAQYIPGILWLRNSPASTRR